MTLITSRQNTYIKHLVRLKNEASYRMEKGSFLIEGKTLCEELKNSDQVVHFILKEGLTLNSDKEIYLKEHVFEKISHLKNSEGYLAEVKMPTNPTFKNLKKMLVLDRLQNPQNLGALARSAVAFGFEGLFCLDSCDPYHPQALRASMGALLHLSILKGHTADLKSLLKEHHGQIWAADAKGQPIENLKLNGSSLYLMLGNEASGVDLSAFEEVQKVALPIKKIDSLNVAVAGSLLMYLLRGEDK